MSSKRLSGRVMWGKQKNQKGELLIPPAVKFAKDAKEHIRFWTANGNSHISLHLAKSQNLSEGQEGILWGVFLADIARHAVDGMTQSDETKMSSDELLQQITSTFLDDLGMAADSFGTILDK